MLVLFWGWGGPTPPRWVGMFNISTAPLVYELSVFGVLGFFYYPYCEARALFRKRSDLAMIGIVLSFGVLISNLMPNAYNHEAGRWGGYLWEVVRIFPTLFDRSIIFTLLVPVGALFLLGFFREIAAKTHQGAFIWIVAVAAWSFSTIANQQAFHRYFEPLVLVFLILAVALLARGRLHPVNRTLLITLIAIQLSITLFTAWRWILFAS
jgi:hypothetical protein